MRVEWFSFIIFKKLKWKRRVLCVWVIRTRSFYKWRRKRNQEQFLSGRGFIVSYPISCFLSLTNDVVNISDIVCLTAPAYFLLPFDRCVTLSYKALPHHYCTRDRSFFALAHCYVCGAVLQLNSPPLRFFFCHLLCLLLLLLNSSQSVSFCLFTPDDERLELLYNRINRSIDRLLLSSTNIIFFLLITSCL